GPALQVVQFVYSRIPPFPAGGYQGEAQLAGVALRQLPSPACSISVSRYALPRPGTGATLGALCWAHLGAFSVSFSFSSSLAATAERARITCIGIAALGRRTGDLLLAGELPLETNCFVAQSLREPLEFADLAAALVELPAVDADQTVKGAHRRLLRTWASAA